MTRGILYLAKGGNFIKEARKSAKQVDSVMPSVPISIVTNEEISAPYFDKVIVDRSCFELYDKPKALRLSPYDKTIYLDADIYLNKNISEVFDILGSFEMALVRDHIEYNIRKLSEPHPIEDVPEGFPEFNGGFIAYRNTRSVMDFFHDWENRIQSNHAYDQRTLRPALYNSSVRFTCLPPRYNCIYMLNGCVTGDVKVFHAASGDLKKNIDINEAIRKFGKSDLPRIYQTYEDTILVDLSPPFYLKLWITLKDKGFTETLRKITKKISTSIR